MFSQLSNHLLATIVLMALSAGISIKIAAEVKTMSLRDPTQPIGYRQTTNKERPLILQAIFFGEGNRKAIINGSAVKEGGSVNGKLIVDIKPTQVTYKMSGGLRVLKLRQSIFNK